MDEMIDFLQTTHLFKGFDRDQLAVLAEVIEERRIGAGENILAENESTCSLYLLRKGQVKISIGYPFNLKSALPIRTLGPGEAFGEFSFIDRLPRSASARTVTDVSVLMLSRDDYDRLASERPAMALVLLQNIAVTLTEQIRDITALWRDSI